ncbi:MULTISPECIES: helix-turn-helix domain-containing protein [Gimesia]|uniref:Helix-turn-helix transcriptional regulator n=2 Tax=Gimesia TaxID=1649453 RepID=A0A6I6AG68_9PLAN|nr:MULTISPECIES: helix-turn-helix transcriptional regulator [Gimesia]QGQ25604.1 helix-turn-helix transcriptional regulator [Gimesia benthica]
MEKSSQQNDLRSEESVMSLAHRIQMARKQAGLTLEQLASQAEVSKTYIWELENDQKGEKKPSADVLLRIANALKTTIAELLGLPTVQADDRNIEISKSLREFCEWMEKTDRKLSEEEIRDLAAMRFRGGQPKSRDDWDDLYRTLKRITKG